MGAVACDGVPSRVMEHQEAAERDIWRKGLALTGDPEGATRVLVSVWKVRTDVLRLHESRVARLVATRSRDVIEDRGGYGRGLIEAARRPGGPAISEEARRAVEAIGDLEQRLREAWVMRRVLGMDDLDIARATGVAKASVERNAANAEETLQLRLEGEYAKAVEDWSGFVMSYEPRVELEQARQRQKRIVARKRVLAILQFLVLLGALGVVIWIGLGMLEAEEARDRGESPEDPYSVPMKSDDAEGS